MTQLSHKTYDAHDAAMAAIQIKKIKSGATSLIPADVVHAIAVKGMHPARAWREYRGWTGAELAKKAGLAHATLSQMETGKRKGALAAYKAIARALGITTASLID